MASRGACHYANTVPGKKLPQEAYNKPTSSFAGGKKRSSIFGSAPEGDSLLKAHHEKTIRPLLERAIAAGTRRNGSSRGEITRCTLTQCKSFVCVRVRVSVCVGGFDLFFSTDYTRVAACGVRFEVLPRASTDLLCLLCPRCTIYE